MNQSKLFRILLAIAVLTGLITPSIGKPSPVKAAGLSVTTATPTGSGAPLESLIVITFSQAIQPETFAATINSMPVVPTQLMISPDRLTMTVDPGELEYGQLYQVVVSGTVLDEVGDPLGSDYLFDFTVIENPASKRPTTSVVIPAGPFESGQTYTLIGQATGYIWERDTANPLELRHWDVNGTDTGSSPMLHPTALYFPAGEDGYKFWLYYTPYPPASDENPVLMRSNDGVNFDVEAPGVIQNPLFTYAFQPPYDTQNLADPEAYRVGNTWMIFYEQEALSGDVQPFMGSGGNIGVAFSTDGKNWEPYGGPYSYDPGNPPTGFPTEGNPVVKPTIPTSSVYRSGEMAVIFKDGVYHMWRTVIDSGLFIYHDTASDPRGPWTLQPDNINMGSYEYGPHPDVVYDAERDLYLMLYLIPSGASVGQLGLYYASSPSGAWTPHPVYPLFSAQAATWEGSRLYRASMVNVDGQWYMYYSGNTTVSPQIGLAREVAGVRRVEVSTNGGTTWQTTTLNPNGTWSYNWTPGSDGTYTIMARVTDDFMLGDATSGQPVNVGDGALPTPQNPVLLVTNNAYASNPYNEYLSEILQGEGLLAFQRVELSSLLADPDPLGYLANYEVVLLAETSLTTAEEQLWRDYVTAGGGLVAMRPDPDLADLFGLTYSGPRTEQLLQFLKYDTTSGPGNGIVDLSLQYHGQADNYTLNGAVALANLWDGINTPSTNPAVVLNGYGNGQAAAYTFDLAKSIVLTRQGNPAWKDSEGDGLGGYRPGDLFFRTNGDKYLAPERTRIPQADEQQRFLANLLMGMTDTPLPRMWYLPDGKKSLMVNTGDAEGYAETQLDHTLNDAASYGGAFTSYLMESGIAGTTPAKEASWQAAGHETGPHVYGGGADTCAALAPAYAQIVANLQAKFGHGASTARSHTIDWCGYVDMAAIEANNGTGLDVNYYHYLPQLLAYGDNANGYFTGSGLPQKFMSEGGDILSIYQALTEWPDEWFDDNGYSASQTAQIIQDMFTAAENGFYSAFVANIHHVRYDNIGGDITYAWANLIWAYARDNGIPLWSAEMLLDFTTARNTAQFNNLNWNGTTLSFDFNAPISGQDLTLMIPARVGSSDLLSVTFAGNPQTYTTETIKGLDYALFTTQSAGGAVVASYGLDTTPPVVSNPQATSITDTSANIIWNTDEPATSRVDYGLAADNLIYNQQSTILVTNHSLALSGLNPNTIYYYQVSSVDRAGNPPSVSSILSFTTSLPRWVETSVADFSDGTLADIQVSDEGGGALSLGLASGFYDHFDGSALNETDWLSRNIIGNPINVSVAGSQVTTADGTYIRTNQTWFQETVEGLVTLRDGTNSHFGWATTVQSGDDGIEDPHWMIFSAKNGNLEARTRLNDGQGTNEEVNTVLTGISLGVPHNLKIVWNADNTIEFWVDGYLQVTHTRAFTEPMRVYLTSNAAQPASADWVSVSGAYALAGTYTSSVFDTGGSAGFEALSWTGNIPAGTTVGFETRTSANLVDWSPWQPLSAGGVIDSPDGQLFQYRLSLTTSDAAITPRVNEVVVTYQPGEDVTPPMVVSTVPVDQAIGVPLSQIIQIHYNEPINPTTFNATLDGAAFTVDYQDSYRTVILDPTSDLQPLTTYSLSIAAGVEDTHGNPTAAPYVIGFTTGDLIYNWIETSIADFSDGTLTDVQVSAVGDGAIQLAQTGFYDHFEGTAINPLNWTSADWSGGAVDIQVADSLVTVNAMDYIKSVPTFNQTQVEAYVRYSANGGYLNFAVGTGLNAPCIYMTIGPSTPGTMRVQTYETDYTEITTFLPAYNSIIGDGQFHYLKIEWTGSQVRYYIDNPDTPVATHTGFGRPLDGNYNIMLSSSGLPFAADWISAAGYGGSGTYVSNSHAAGENSLFQTLVWTGSQPVGTTVAFETRTSINGIDWTDWQAVAAENQIASPAGSYIQYRVAMTSNDPAITPTIEQVTIAYTPQAPESIPPVVDQATPTSTDVPVSTNVMVTFSELINTATFSAQMNGVSVPSAWISFSQSQGRSIVTINPASDLEYQTLYTVLVPGSVEDLSGNPMGLDYQWNFRTEIETLQWIQTTTTDFESGTQEGLTVMEDSGGELSLPPALYDRFLGSSLSSQWVSGLWSGGVYSPVIASGVLTHNSSPGFGSYVRSVDTFDSGTTLRSRLMFSKGGNTTAPYLYFGLAGTGLAPWALFGTTGIGDQLYATTYLSGSQTNIPLGNLFDQWHEYAISWFTDRIEFRVDGVLRHTQTISMPGPLYTFFSASNATPAGATISSDWVRLEAYGQKQLVSQQILNDTFTVPDGPAANWDLISNPQYPPATWVVANNRFVHSPTSTSYHPAVLNNSFPTLSSFNLQTEAMSPNGTGFFGLVWGVQDNAHYYFAQFYPGSGLVVYRVNSWAPNFDGNNIASNASAPVPVANQWFTLRLEGRNGQYQIYVNGILQLTFTDTVYPSGRVGVLGYGGITSTYDNVIVEQLNESTVLPNPGVYTSPVFDAGQTVRWSDLSHTATTPTGTSLIFETQTSLNGSDWSTWQAVNSPIASPDGRYFRYRATFATSDTSTTPTLEDVTVSYTNAPTAVTVSSFIGSASLGTAQLDWTTASEMGVVGFNIYRSDTTDGEKQKLNADLIPAQHPDQLLGASYQFSDAVEPGKRYYYWLELVKSQGNELLEPVVVDADYLIRLPLIVR